MRVLSGTSRMTSQQRVCVNGVNTDSTASTVLLVASDKDDVGFPEQTDDAACDESVSSLRRRLWRLGGVTHQPLQDRLTLTFLSDLPRSPPVFCLILSSLLDSFRPVSFV